MTLKGWRVVKPQHNQSIKSQSWNQKHKAKKKMYKILRHRHICPKGPAYMIFFSVVSFFLTHENIDTGFYSLIWESFLTKLQSRSQT